MAVATVNPTIAFCRPDNFATISMRKNLLMLKKMNKDGEVNGRILLQCHPQSILLFAHLFLQDANLPQAILTYALLF
jgi:hypothetical protein